MNKCLLILLSILAFGCSSEDSAKIYTELPQHINPADKFVFYSHGLIVEGDNPRPEHPRWGVYDFPAVVKALSDPRYNLIAFHRPKHTDPVAYAKKLSAQVRHLMDQGVPASNISLVGFSRGGFITVLASNELKNTELNFVIIAACTTNLTLRNDISVYGHFYSIYETSDTVGSCSQLTTKNYNTLASVQELIISTGKEHGAFYQPRIEWVGSLKWWLSTDADKRTMRK